VFWNKGLRDEIEICFFSKSIIVQPKGIFKRGFQVGPSFQSLNIISVELIIYNLLYF
jgi:hypothetical protein